MTYTNQRHDATILFCIASVHISENTHRQWHIKEIKSFQVLKIKKYQAEACVLC